MDDFFVCVRKHNAFECDNRAEEGCELRPCAENQKKAEHCLHNRGDHREPFGDVPDNRNTLFCNATAFTPERVADVDKIDNGNDAQKPNADRLEKEDLRKQAEHATRIAWRNKKARHSSTMFGARTTSGRFFALPIARVSRKCTYRGIRRLPLIASAGSAKIYRRQRLVRRKQCPGSTPKSRARSYGSCEEKGGRSSASNKMHKRSIIAHSRSSDRLYLYSAMRCEDSPPLCERSAIRSSKSPCMGPRNLSMYPSRSASFSFPCLPAGRRRTDTSIIERIYDASLAVQKPNDVVLHIPEWHTLRQIQAPRIAQESGCIFILIDAAVIRKRILNFRAACD